MSAVDILNETYQIIGEIGSGGGGVVYHAVHKRLQTDVVIKKIKDEVLGKVQSRQEADVLKKLKHPFLPRVYDFIETEDGVYTVMDFIKGQNMEQALEKHGRFAPQDVRKWAIQLGEALDYLHRQNPPIIHSDIKPANIMLTPEGDICLIDFNISLAMGNNEELAVGISAGFSPPEQYRDPELYARVTHNYTLQKAFNEKISNISKEKVTVSVEDEETQLLENEDFKTVLLTDGVQETVLLSDADQETVLLTNDDSETVLLTEEDQETILLTKNDSADEESYPLKEQIIINKNSTYIPYIGRGITTKSDIFSLGMCLLTFLMGKSPDLDFENIPDAFQCGQAVSEGLATIINKMVKINPEDRYKDGTDFLLAIRNSHKLDKRYIAMHKKELVLRIVSVICILVGLGVCSFGMIRIRAEKETQYFEAIANIEQMINDNNIDTARELILWAKADRNNVAAYREEVFLEYSVGDYDKCIDIGNNYILTQPFYVETEYDKSKLSEIYYLVGNAYYEKKDYFEAERYLAEAINLNKNNSLFYRDYAITLAKNDKLDVANNCIDEAVQLGMTDDSLNMVKGELASASGNYEEAVQFFKKAIDITTDSQIKRRASLLCANAYENIPGGLDEEIAFLSQCIINSDNSDIMALKENLASVYLKKAQENPEESMEFYSKALDIFYEIFNSGYMTYQLMENIGILNENIGNFDKAKEMFLSMRDQYPNRYEVYMRLAFLEADIQQNKDILDRNYEALKEYYDMAMEKYDSNNGSTEMEMLKQMITDIISGGWLLK